MSITVNVSKKSVLPGDTSRPATVKGQVWDPVAEPMDGVCACHVRTLSLGHRTPQRRLPLRTIREDVTPKATKFEVVSQNLGHFLLGGVFGLALVGGLLFVDAADDMEPVTSGPQSSLVMH